MKRSFSRRILVGALMALGVAVLASQPVAATDQPLLSVEGNAGDVSLALSNLLDAEVELRVPEPDLSDFEFREFPVWSAMDALSEVGDLTINSVPYPADGRSRRPGAALSEFLETPIELEIQDANPSQISKLLTDWAGIPVSFESNERQITMDLRDVTGRRLLDLLAERGDLRVAGVEWR